MKTIPLLLTTALSLASTAVCASLVTPTVEGDQLSWDAIPALTINIHRGDGSYVESLPGTTTRWTAAEPGEYYLVAADDGDWRDWPRSDVVTVEDGSNSKAPMPFVNFIGLSWEPVSALSINVHRGDGTFIESLPGDASYWQPDEFGDYFLVASNDEPWQNWPRSDTITVSYPDARPDLITGLRADVYSQSAAEVFWDRVPQSGIRYRVIKGGEIVAETDGTSWFSNNLTPGSTTVIHVLGIDADGVESASRSVPVTTPGDRQAQPYPTISRDNHEALLTEVFGIYFGAQYREWLSTMANQTVPDLQATFEPDFSAGTPYACINGGRLVFEGPYTVQFDDCRVEDAVYQGNFNVHQYYGDTDRVSSSGVSIRADSKTEFHFSGSLDGAIQATPGFYSAEDMSVSILSADDEWHLEHANLEYTFAHLLHSSPFLNTSFSGSFDLRSSLTGNELVHVSTLRYFDHSQLLTGRTDWNYSSGILSLTAADGSQLILNADTGDSDTVSMQLINGRNVDEFEQTWLTDWTVWQQVLAR